jgi:RHS repeat-associated protein
MKFSDFICREAVRTRVQAHEKEAVIRAMAQALVEAKQIQAKDFEGIVEAILGEKRGQNYFKNSSDPFSPLRPSEPTWTSSSVYDGYVQLATYGYNAASGRTETTTVGVSKNGSNTTTTATKMFYDALGRRTAVAENYVNYAWPADSGAGGGTNNVEDRVTKFAYNGLGQQTSLTAVNVTGAGTVNQETKYLYEDLYNAVLVTNTIYPDSSDTDSSGTDQVEVSYNLDGTPATRTDQRGVVHTYTYDDARRLVRDGATSIPSGVDDHVKSIAQTYDDLGRVLTVTSYSNNDGTGTVRNQVKYTYDITLGLLTKSEQSHEGAVAGGTPAVDYAYDTTASSSVYTNGLRQKSTTYPDGRVMHMTYGTAEGIADKLNRIELIEADSGGSPGTDLVQYGYNGTGRLAVADYLVPDVKLDLYQGTAGTYAGYDRFGRVVKQQWYDYTGGTAVRDQFDYTYDYAGNRLSRDIPSSLYSTDDQDQVYVYDTLHRLATFDEGTKSGTSISGTPVREQDWTLDQLGNWPGFVVKANGNTTLNQSRAHNSVNEIDTDNTHGDVDDPITTTTGTNWYDPEYDAAGNMTMSPWAGALTGGMTAVFDAWNRLVEAKLGTFTLTRNEYDGLGRRIVRLDGLFDPDITYDYYYNESWQLIEERKDADADPLNQYVWHPHYIDALAIRYYDANTDNSGILEYYHAQDANFNITAVLEDDGDVLERYQYTPYGEVTILNADFTLDNDGTDVAGTHFYTGRERDYETGLQLNRNRFYAAHLGRWMNRDPIGYEGGTSNLYEYIGSRPVHENDPNGTDPVVRGPIDGLDKLRKAICQKGAPYKNEKSGCEVCDWTCECPRGWTALHIPMSYYGWPCDQAPEIYCVKQRGWRDSLADGCRVLGGIIIMCTTIVEDVGTGGVGIADDPPCIAAAGVMICGPRRPEPEPIEPGPNPMEHMCCGGGQR